MSNNTSISADLINRRLGGGGQKTFYQPDLADADDGQPDSSSMSAGFVMLMLVFFIAVGGGTYFVAGSDYSWYELKRDFRSLGLFES